MVCGKGEEREGKKVQRGVQVLRSVMDATGN